MHKFLLFLLWPWSTKNGVNNNKFYVGWWIEWMCNDVLLGDISANISIYSRLANILPLPAPTTHRRNDLFNNKVTSLPPTHNVHIAPPHVKWLSRCEVPLPGGDGVYGFLLAFSCACVLSSRFRQASPFLSRGRMWNGRMDGERGPLCIWTRLHIAVVGLPSSRCVSCARYYAEKTGNCKTAINQQEHNIGARDPPSTSLQKRKMFHLWTGLTTEYWRTDWAPAHSSVLLWDQINRSIQRRD